MDKKIHSENLSITNNESDELKNVRLILTLSEESLLNWFGTNDETSDIKNLNYAITCLKRIVEAHKLINLNSVEKDINEVSENGDSGTNLGTFSKTISELIEEVRQENGTEETS